MKTIKYILSTYGQIISALGRDQWGYEKQAQRAPLGLVTILTWKCLELSISWIRISLAIFLYVTHALKNGCSLVKEQKTGKSHSAELIFWLQNTHFSTIKLLSSPAFFPACGHTDKSYSQKQSVRELFLAVSSRKPHTCISLTETLEGEIRWHIPQGPCWPSEISFTWWIKKGKLHWFCLFSMISCGKMGPS